MKALKIFLFIAAFLTFIVEVNAQIGEGGMPPSLDHNSSKRVENITEVGLGAYFGSSLFLRDDAFYYFANLNINYKKHGFFLGPVILTSVIYIDDNSYRGKEGNKVKLGFRTAYEYYLLSDTNKFNIFIQYEFMYSGRNKAVGGNYIYYPNNIRLERIINQETSSLFNLIGVGLNISVTPKMNFNLSISSGLENWFEQTEIGGIASSQYNRNFVACANLGVVYKFL